MDKRWLLLVALTIGVFVVLVGYGDFGDTLDEISSLSISYLIAGLALALANYLLYLLLCYNFYI